MNTLLRRLPVKPLLSGFRCTVSKPLCSLVDKTTSFVPKDEIFPRGENFTANIYPGGRTFYSVNVDSMYDFTATKIADCPLGTYLSGTMYVGSCNGLVCLWKHCDKGKDDIFLWNPTTREIRKLPRAYNMLIPTILIGSSVIGFGYDHVNDDYKVMRTFDSQLYGIMVSVYSLKSNSWTRAETILINLSLRGSFGVFANGSLYWLGGLNKMNIVAFDLGVHRHRKLQIPAGADENNDKRLHVFNRCLCLLDIFPDSRTDMWLMNSNGVENSWSKFLSVEQSTLGSFRVVYPLAFSKTQNEILLMVILVDGQKLVWYDRESNKVKNVTLHGFPHSFDLLVYNESLFQISDSELDGKQSEEEVKKQKENTLRDYLDKCGIEYDDARIERAISES